MCPATGGIEMDLFWIEVRGNTLTNLETDQTVTLRDYAPQVAQNSVLHPDKKYDGKVILVTGEAHGNDIYRAEIKGGLT